MPFDISNNNGLWNAVHSHGRCGGPRSLTVAGQCVLTDYSVRIDAQSDDMLHSKDARVFHKAGLTVFSSRGTFTGMQQLSQISRYAANTLRTTWDLNWPKNTPFKQAVRMGSATLHGKWCRAFVISREDALQPIPGNWQSLSSGQTLTWDKAPLSVVFERDDGIRLEVSVGFDIWRWDAGLGLAPRTALSAIITDDTITLDSLIAEYPAPAPEPAPDPNPDVVDKESEVIAPEARDYRFMAILAWSSPLMSAPSIPANLTNVHFRPGNGGLALSDFRSGGATTIPSIAIDLSEMPLVPTAGVLAPDATRHGFCLESGYVMGHLKRIIRQIASLAPQGHLVIKGLTPALCNDGAHCSKKGPRLHWDLQEILTFASWAKNCLGSGWDIQFPQPEGWRELPSLAYLHLPNGFDYNL